MGLDSEVVSSGSSNWGCVVVVFWIHRILQPQMRKEEVGGGRRIGDATCVVGVLET